MLVPFFLYVGNRRLRVVLPNRALPACHGHNIVIHIQHGLMGVINVVMRFQMFDGIADERNIKTRRVKVSPVAASLVRMHSVTEGGCTHPQ